MDYLTIISVGVGLSFDSFAVSVCSGLCAPRIRIIQAVKMAAILAVFQGTMPLVGWLVGKSLLHVIKPIHPWIAFLLLTFIGSKMIWESITNRDESLPDEKSSPFTTRVLLLLGFATSIDALAIGFSFAGLVQRILFAALIIGAITMLASLSGVALGKRGSCQSGKVAEITGGLVILGIGLHILFSALFSTAGI